MPEGASASLQAKHSSRDRNGALSGVAFGVLGAAALTADHADFIAKLRQIEEQANALGAEITPGLAGTRLQHILVLAKMLRGRLEFGGASIVRRAASAPPPGDAAV